MYYMIQLIAFQTLEVLVLGFQTIYSHQKVLSKIPIHTMWPKELIDGVVLLKTIIMPYMSHQQKHIILDLLRVEVIILEIL